MLRRKTIQTKHGTIETPAFLPDATYGSINSISFTDARSAGVDELVTTTLHLETKLGSDYIAKYGGLHKFFNWNRPILTDSGGFQVFSLIHRRPNKHNSINDHGASFKDPVNGSVHVLTPESSQLIQHKLGSDLRVVLDEPLASGADDRYNKISVNRTTAWARRSKQKFEELAGGLEQKPQLMAVVQGAGNFEMRKRSAEQLIDIGFDSYNFGGFPFKPNGKLDLELSEYLVNLLPENKIRYAMGVGNPDDIVALAHMGWDLFDCVLPTRNARHGYIYVNPDEGDKNYKNFGVIHLKTKRYEFADEPLSTDTHPTLRNISKAYLRHLIRIKEPAGFRLTTLHNLWFYSRLMNKLRQGII